MLKYQNRDDAIKDFFDRLMTEKMASVPYLVKTPQGGWEEYKDCERLDEKPVMVKMPIPSTKRRPDDAIDVEAGAGGGDDDGDKGGKHKQKSYKGDAFQLGILNEYFHRRLLYAFTPQHHKRIDDLLDAQGLDGPERKLFKDRLDQGALTRLGREHYEMKDIDEDWAAQRSITDVFRYPTALALTAVLRTSTLGRTKSVIPGSAVRPEEQRYKQAFMTAYAPRSFTIKTTVQDDPTKDPKLVMIDVPMNRFLTSLEIHRASDNNAFMIFRNQSSTSAPQRAHLRATFQHAAEEPVAPLVPGAPAVPKKRPGGDDMLHYMTQDMSRIGLDLDFIMASRRFMSLGAPVDKFFENYRLDAKLADHEPVNYIPNLDKINAYIRAHVSLKDRTGKLPKPQALKESFVYPRDIILAETLSAASRHERLRKKNYAEMEEFSTMYLPITYEELKTRQRAEAGRMVPPGVPAPPPPLASGMDDPLMQPEYYGEEEEEEEDAMDLDEDAAEHVEEEEEPLL